MERVKRYLLFLYQRAVVQIHTYGIWNMFLTIYFRWVNNQDFQRASPEPNLHGEPNDLFHKFLQPQNAMHPLQILQPHHLLHKVAQPEILPRPENFTSKFYPNPKFYFNPKFYPVFSLNCGLHLDLLIKEYSTRTIFQEYHLNWHLLQVSQDLKMISKWSLTL